MQDDEAYNHSAAMFLGAPITIQIPVISVTSNGSAAVEASRSYLLEPVRDFSGHVSCVETRTWIQLRDLLRQGKAFTGGLGGN